eukprot:CAMPEP_0168556174 /NCGR_PEP_ID=MMETSP0413-20121227/8738_1 /TAXON_ID=136452 /ORGANISM="Filamoeba nolandi, Strain NC-AS-23-1" /LENGTH=406 /DNA_ID=CAMNT_0008587095 /DNA_START=114 /DNA_END=1334 /DNA_ORIENTATION=-
MEKVKFPLDFAKSAALPHPLVHTVILVNLEPDTQYFYRVGHKTFGWSPEYSFHTGPAFLAPQVPINIVAYGDMGVFPTAQKVVNNVHTYTKELAGLNERVNFILHAGDLAYAFKNFTKWDLWFKQMSSLTPYTPYMVAPGNRDEPEMIEQLFRMPTDKLPSQELYKPTSKRNSYYSFDYLTVHFISLSSVDDLKVGSQQYQWLTNDLFEASKRITSKHDILEWIIVMIHSPLYSSSDGHTQGNKEIRQAIEPLLHQYNVSLLIAGDDHGYERTFPVFEQVADTWTLHSGGIPVFRDPLKIIHMVVGTAGVGLDGWVEAPSWSAVRFAEHGFLHIRISDNTCKVKFINSENSKVMDEFWVVKTPKFEHVFVPYMFVILPFALIGFFLYKNNKCSWLTPSPKKRTYHK